MNSYKDKQKELYSQNFTDVECRECEGEGIVEVGPHCFKPASDCCGGCYKEVACNVCRGTGNITIDEDDDEMSDAHMMYCSIQYRLYHFKLLAEAVKQEIEILGIEAVPELQLIAFDQLRLTSLLGRIAEDLNDMALAKADTDWSPEDDEDYKY
jgi:hypothetical protein